MIVLCPPKMWCSSVRHLRRMGDYFPSK